jgi:hypothetical protein
MNNFCKLCNYTTNNISHYYRHCNAVKHLVNEKKTYYCVLCNKQLSNINSYNSHKYKDLKKSKKNSNNLNNSNQLDNVKNEINENIIKSKKEVNENIIKSKEEVNENIIKSKEEVKTVVNKAITKATSLIKYLMQHHQNVPPIKKISDKESIKLLRIDYECPLKKDNDFVLEHRLIYDHANNRFIKNISKSILNIINHKKPKSQTIYNTDSSRHNYVIKTTQEVWDEDKAGIKFSDYIIKPLLKSIEELIKKFRETKIESVNMRKNTLQQNEEHIDLLSKTLNLESDILNDRLITPILKELSPFLRYLQSEIEELEKYNEMEKIQKELEDMIKETNSDYSDDDLDYSIEIKQVTEVKPIKKIKQNNKNKPIDEFNNDFNDNYIIKHKKRLI